MSDDPFAGIDGDDATVAIQIKEQSQEVESATKSKPARPQSAAQKFATLAEEFQTSYSDEPAAADATATDDTDVNDKAEQHEEHKEPDDAALDAAIVEDEIDTQYEEQQILAEEQQQLQDEASADVEADGEPPAEADAAPMEERLAEGSHESQEDTFDDASTTMQALQAQHQSLLHQHQQLQQQVAAVLHAIPSSPSQHKLSHLASDNSRQSDHTTQYTDKHLPHLQQQYETLANTTADAQAKKETLQALHEQYQQKYCTLHEKFTLFKRECFRTAIFEANSSHIPNKRIFAYEQQDELKNNELYELQLRLYTLQQQYAKYDDGAQKGQNGSTTNIHSIYHPSNLHTIDYEQLKIENTSCNEKIHTKQAELQRLQSKLHSNIAIITHLKEKLLYLHQQNDSSTQTVRQLQVNMNDVRDELQRLKLERDALKKVNMQLKQKQGFIGNDALVTDYEARKLEIAEKQVYAGRLQEQYDQLADIIQQGKKIEKQHERAEQEMQRALAGTVRRPGAFTSKLVRTVKRVGR